MFGVASSCRRLAQRPSAPRTARYSWLGTQIAFLDVRGVGEGGGWVVVKGANEKMN